MGEPKLSFVIPAKAGIQMTGAALDELGPGFRRGDEVRIGAFPHAFRTSDIAAGWLQCGSCRDFHRIVARSGGIKGLKSLPPFSVRL